MRKTLLALSALTTGLAGNALAQTAYVIAPVDQRLTLSDVFAEAAPSVQVIFILLPVATAWAVVVWAMSLGKVGRGDAKGLARALGHLRIVRSGGALLGLLAASYNLLGISLGAANTTPSPALNVLAPGLAEASLCVMLGLLATTVAVICERHLEGRMRSAAA